MHIVTQGIVLREVQYKETDKILTVLTRELGKKTVKARSCRRKNSPLTAAAQLLVLSEMTLFDFQDRWTLQEGSTLREFRGVREDLVKLALGSYFAEVVEAVSVEGEETPELFSLLLNSLHALDSLNKPPSLVQAAFDFKCMALVGYAPLLDACAVCGLAEPEKPLLHLREGVLHCTRCRSEVGDGESISLSPAMLTALRHIVCGNPKRLFSFRLEMNELVRLALAGSKYLTAQLERGFRTLDFYRSVTDQTALSSPPSPNNS